MNYSFKIFGLDAFVSNRPGTILTASPTGSQFDWNYWPTPHPTVTAPDAPPSGVVVVSDSADDILSDDQGRDQTLAQDLFLNGTLYPAGAVIEDEYEISLLGADGVTVYRLVAISINDTIVGFTFEGAFPPEGEVLSYIQNSAGDGQSMVPCFLRGSRILTPQGNVPVEALAAGDLVITRDHGTQPIRWIGSGRVVGRGRLAPIRFAPGSIGNSRPLYLSPHHRVLIEDTRLELLFGTPSAFVEARDLVNGRDITAVEQESAEYFHILLERHETVFAEGAPTETLLLGPVTAGLLSFGARRELQAIFPDLTGVMARSRSAHPCLTGREARLLAA